MQPEMPNVMTVSVSHIRHALQESYSAQEAANLSRIVCCEMLGQTAVDYYLGKDMILSPSNRSITGQQQLGKAFHPKVDDVLVDGLLGDLLEANLQ